MEDFLHECFDERGDRLEAHFRNDLKAPGEWFHVEVMSEKGLRGAFDLYVPVGTTIGAALQERIRAEGIRARN